MNEATGPVAALFAELASTGLESLLTQAIALLLAGLVALAAYAASGVMAERLVWKPGPRVRAIFSLGLFALGLWIGVELLSAEGQANGWLRLVALTVTATTAIALVWRTLGGSTFGWALTALIVFVAAVEAFGLVAPVIAALDRPHINLGAVRLSPWFVIKGLGIAGALFWTANRLGDLLDQGIAREKAISRSGQVLFVKIARAALWVVALMVALGFLGVDVTSLAVLSGAVGLGLGFGLQKVISNYVAGLILLMDRSIKPGDVIELDLGDGPVRGEVTQLAGRFTALRLRAGTETLVPNELLISSPVSNWTHTDRNVQMRLPIGVAYDTDVEQAMALCAEGAGRAKRVLKTPAPFTIITGFGDSSVDLEVRFWIADAELGVKNVSSLVYLEIWKLFRENGVEIPFPQRDLHLRSSVPLTVTSAPGDA